MQNTPINPLPVQTMTTFQADDFAPRLRGDQGAGSAPFTAAEPNSQLNVGSGVSILEPATDRAASANPAHPNAVVSYNDPLPVPIRKPMDALRDKSNTGVALYATQPSTFETSGRHNVESWNRRDSVKSSTSSSTSANSFRSETSSGSTPRNMPLGLHDDDRNRLSRLTNSTSQVDKLPAIRYENHVTRMGDTLHSISTRYYGTSEYYLDIYLANRHQLRNPAEIPNGITLRIPIYQ
jgi:LysM repeat protein